MIDAQDRAWLDDNNILDRHALGKLNAEEEQRLSALRQSDATLDADVRLNAQLIAGIRFLARRQLKARLQSNLGVAPRAQRLHLPALLKWAAVLAVATASLWLIIRYTHPLPEKATVTETPLPDKKTDKDSSERIQKPGKQVESVAAQKKSSRKQDKPALLSAPTLDQPSKQRRKLNADAIKFLRPNEVSATWIHDADTVKSILFFKNPSDLAAVNIQETQFETSDTLEWFYVNLEEHALSLYLDNIRYLSRFSDAVIVETPNQLRIRTAAGEYVVDRTSPDRFKKASLIRK